LGFSKVIHSGAQLPSIVSGKFSQSISNNVPCSACSRLSSMSENLLFFLEPDLRRWNDEMWRKLDRTRVGFCLVVRHAGMEGDECVCEICSFHCHENGFDCASERKNEELKFVPISM